MHALFALVLSHRVAVNFQCQSVILINVCEEERLHYMAAKEVS